MSPREAGDIVGSWSDPGAHDTNAHAHDAREEGGMDVAGSRIEGGRSAAIVGKITPGTSS